MMTLFKLLRNKKRIPKLDYQIFMMIIKTTMKKMQLKSIITMKLKTNLYPLIIKQRKKIYKQIKQKIYFI